MMDTRLTMQAETISGLNAEGRNVTVSLASVLAIVPDPVRLHWTRLHVADGTVLVEGDYEDWMERLSAGWTSARS